MANQEAKRVLVADSDDQSRNEIAEAIRERGHEVTVAEDGLSAATTVRDEGPFDVIVLPCVLPGKSGLALCRELSSRHGGELDTILLLEVDDPQVRGLARMCGARASLPRPFAMKDLVALVEQTHRRPDVGSLLAEREDKIKKGELKPETSLSVLLGEGSFLDELMDQETGLYNQTYVLIKLEEEFKKSQRYGAPLVCALLRLEGASDVVVNQVAGALLTESRDTDVAGRVTPRDFLLILPNTNLAGGKVLFQRLFASLGIPTVSKLRLGLSVFPSDETQAPDDLIRIAETGLRKASSLMAENFGEPGTESC